MEEDNTGIYNQSGNVHNNQDISFHKQNSQVFFSVFSVNIVIEIFDGFWKADNIFWNNSGSVIKNTDEYNVRKLNL